MPIQRITYFKVIDDGHFATLFDAYRTLKKDNQKVPILRALCACLHLR